ncbi:MAG: HisA/HisF-related TIM barrel protein [Planctomycetaceae bacterium]
MNIDPRRVASGEPSKFPNTFAWFREPFQKKNPSPRDSSTLTLNPQRASGDVHINGGRVPTGLDAVAWALEVERLGAGEIVLTSMDADGTKDGFDLEITKAVAEVVEIPVVASGGPVHLNTFAKPSPRDKRVPLSLQKYFSLRGIHHCRGKTLHGRTGCPGTHDVDVGSRSHQPKFSVLKISQQELPICLDCCYVSLEALQIIATVLVL